MMDGLCIGSLVMIDECRIIDISDNVSIWNLRPEKFDYYSPSYTQVDCMTSGDVAVVIGISYDDGTIQVLTCRGNVGFAWMEHLKIV